MGLFTAAAAVAALALSVAADKPLHINHKSYQDGDLGEKPVQQFYSSPLKAAVWQVNKFDAEKVDTDSPYMFLTGRYGEGWGPSIVSSKDLSLIWADQHYGGLAQTTRVWNNWKGHDRVMTVYSGGAVQIYNQEYELLYSVTPKGNLDGVMPDSHEAMLTDDDTVLMVVCPAREVDLSKVGGPAKGKKVAACHVQEVDPDTNKVLFQFNTLDYFKPEDSVWEYKGDDVWDFSHMNAVQKTPEGNFLISYRHLSTVVLVDGKSAEVIWVMWGKKNMFEDISEDGHSAEFHFQHEPRLTGPNTFTLFDNHKLGNGWCEEPPCSRGLEVEFDSENKTVKMVNEWYHPQELVSASRGGVQRLPSGNTIVAWGQNPMYTEYTPDGELVLDIQRGQVLHLEHGVFDVIAYRIWKDNWVGRPTWDPSIACTSDDAGKYIHVSWNGATEVHQWVLLASDDKADLDGAAKVVATLPRMGFETSFTVQDTRQYARVVALDAAGKILGSTAAVDTATEKEVKLDYKVKAVADEESDPEPEVIMPPEPAPYGTDGNGNSDATTDHSHDHDHDNDETDDEEGYSSTLIVAGIAVIGACIGMTVAMVLFFRRRRSNRATGGEAGNDASYGLLMREQDGEFHDKDDDETSTTPAGRQQA